MFLTSISLRHRSDSTSVARRCSRRDVLFTLFFSIAIFVGHTDVLNINVAFMLSLVAFFIYLVLGVFVYRWSKLKYEELVGEKPREDDRFMISIFIFSRSNE